MDPKHREFKKLRRDRFGVKMIAGSFLAIGGLLFTMSLLAYLDPEATINVNGLPTASPKAKLQAVLFSSVFMILGIVGLLLPKRLLNRMLIARTSLLPAAGESLFQKLYQLLGDYPLRSCVIIALFSTLAFGGHFYGEFVASDDKSSVVIEFVFVLWFISKAGRFDIHRNRGDSP